MSPVDCTSPPAPSQSRTLFLPEGFDPGDVLPFGVHKYADGIRVVLDRIVTGSILSGHRDGDVPLSRVAMTELFGNARTWYKVKDALLDRDVLACDEKYWNGPDPKTKWFRMTPAWGRRVVVSRKLSDPKCLGWLARQDAERPIRENWAPIHHRLHEWATRIEMDPGLVAAGIEAIEPGDRNLAEKACAMADGCLRMPTLDGYGFRFHTPLSSIPKVCRPAVRVFGRPLVEIDISNCQPFLLGLSCLEFPVHPCSVDPHHWNRERERRAGGEPGSYSLLRGALLRICYQNAPIAVRPPGDLIDYLEACSTGRYYETLAQRAGLRCSRDMVKKFSCKLMYGKTRDTAPWRSYCEGWPTLAARLELLKREDHHHASMELQRFETDLMIRGVCEDLVRVYPEMPLLTIHDCLLVPPEREADVRAAIQRWFGCFGFPVHLK